ncbi:MAG: hypothetical protein KOO60_14700 [Gemmatimonadales bacterium]|nr:hypothetical protein [Gemmatimonadales bacterium]
MPMLKFKPQFYCLSFLFLFPALTLVLEPQVLIAGEVKVIDGVRHIHNEAVPVLGERTLRLTEVWRVDVDEEDELIGVISTALAGPDGTIWLADQQLGQVLVYSSDGELLHKFSRQGEGPGEINNPRGLLWLPDGGLGITDRKQGKITQIDSEGMPLSSIRLQSSDGEPLASAQLRGPQCRGGTLALCGTQFKFDNDKPTQSRFFSIFDTGGREVRRIMEAPSGFDFGARTYDELADYFIDRGAYAVDDLGRVHHAPDYRKYLIEVHDPMGNLVQVVEREYQPQQRTRQEKQEIETGVSMNINGENVAISCDLEGNGRSIEQIEAGDGGGIWVRNGRDNHDQPNRPENIVRTYDVFDAEGHFQEVIHLACDMDPDQDRLLRLADGRWILLCNIIGAEQSMYSAFIDKGENEDVEDDAEPLEIVCLKAILK